MLALGCHVKITWILRALSRRYYGVYFKKRRKSSWITFASPSSSQRGWKKNCRPLSAPSRVRDRMRKTTIKRSGRVAVRYLTCADDFIDFQTEKYTIIQAVIRHATSSHLKAPESSIPLLIWRTLLLNCQRQGKRNKWIFTIYNQFYMIIIKYSEQLLNIDETILTCSNLFKSQNDSKYVTDN